MSETNFTTVELCYGAWTWKTAGFIAEAGYLTVWLGRFLVGFSYGE